MQISKFSILRIIAFNVQKYGKNYCYMSQDKMLQILDTSYKININRRTLNYHLADLRSQGLILSIRRTHRNKDGTLHLLTTATCVTVKACRLLITFGYHFFRSILKRLTKKYLKNETVHAAKVQVSTKFDVDNLTKDEKEKLLEKFHKSFPKRIPQPDL